VKRSPDEPDLALIGKAALLPGMTYMAQMMRDVIADVVTDAMYEFIEEFQRLNGAARLKRGRPAKQQSVREHIEETTYHRRKAIVGERGDERTTAHGWSADPNERKREMKRRVAKRKAKQPSVKIVGLHPRDKAHPGHAAWVEMMRKVQKKSWAKLTQEERDERQRKLQAGHRRAA